MNVRVWRNSPGGFDSHGDPIAGTSTSHLIDGVLMAPRTSSDVSDHGRAGVIVGLTMYAPVNANIRRTDEIEYRGERWQIDGEIGVWENPDSGNVGGIEVALTRGEG